MTDRTRTTHEQPASSRSPESYERLASPALRVAWLLRVSALVGVVSTALGTVVLPGLHGIASDAVITRWEHVSSAFAYAMGLLLLGLLITGVFDFLRARNVGLLPRALIMLGAPGVLVMLMRAFVMPLAPVGTLVLVVATVVVALGGGVVGLRAPHTRVLGLLQLVLALAATLRLTAWLVVALAPDSLRAYTFSRTFGGAGVVAEGGALALVVAWLSTRRRVEIFVGAAIALVCAAALVWVAGRAGPASPSWQLVLRSGLTSPDSGGTALGAIDAFLVAASALLALTCALTPNPLIAVTCAMALALLGRGAFDVPLRALAATVAALWTILAAVDERAMWKALMGARAGQKGETETVEREKK